MYRNLFHDRATARSPLAKPAGRATLAALQLTGVSRG